jgi:RNA polymerase sigma-70 factor (ECF subfamily)
LLLPEPTSRETMSPSESASSGPRSDESLVRGHAAGESGALDALVARHEPRLTAWFARQIPSEMRRRVSPEDLAQETWIVVARQAQLFEDRGDGAFRAWIRVISQTKLKESVRHHLVAAKRGGRREVTRPGRPKTEAFASADPSPSEQAMGNELTDAVARAALRLRPEDREVIRLVQSEGRSLEEAADFLGRTREATRKLLERALARFARRVAEEQGRP